MAIANIASFDWEKSINKKQLTALGRAAYLISLVLIDAFETSSLTVTKE